MATAVAAVVVAPGFAEPGDRVLLVLAAAALICLLPGLLGLWAPALGWGVALLGLTFLARLQLDRDGLGSWTPAVAGGLLVVAELGLWSFQLEGAGELGSGRAGRRLLEILAAAIAAAMTAELVLDGASVLPSPGAWMIVAGAGAVALVMAILLRLTRRTDLA